MKRARRHSHRQAMIAACRLLGYTIEPAANKWGPYKTNHFQYVLVNPVGNVVREPPVRNAMGTALVHVKTFRHMWQAALEALTIEKVDADALKPPREDRDGRGAARAVPQQRDQH